MAAYFRNAPGVCNKLHHKSTANVKTAFCPADSRPSLRISPLIVNDHEYFNCFCSGQYVYYDLARVSYVVIERQLLEAMSS